MAAPIAAAVIGEDLEAPGTPVPAAEAPVPAAATLNLNAVEGGLAANGVHPGIAPVSPGRAEKRLAAALVLRDALLDWGTQMQAAAHRTTGT